MGIYNSNFDFNRYRTFYAVAECKSFSKATELLHVSQPAISHAVKELELQLGTELFIREKRGVKLTVSGEKLFSYLQQAFNHIIMAEKAMADSEEELLGSIRIGLYSHISLLFLPKLLKNFHQKYPKVNFEVYTSTTNELRERLKNKELDFIILQYPIFTNESNFTEEVLVELENCFFTNKKYYDLYKNNSQQLLQLPLILPIRGYQDIDALNEMFKQKNMKIQNNFTIYNVALAKELVKQDLGVGWGLRKCVEEELLNHTFYEIPMNFEIPTTKFSVAYDEQYLNKTEREFLKCLRGMFKKEKSE